MPIASELPSLYGCKQHVELFKLLKHIRPLSLF